MAYEPPLFMPYEPFLLGVGVVFNLLKGALHRVFVWDIDIPTCGYLMSQEDHAQKLYLYQKTREGCGCFWGLCGSSGGKFRENSGKIAGKIFPNCQMLQILGFRAPGTENLPETLGPHWTRPCADLPCGMFFEIDSSSLLELF